MSEARRTEWLELTYRAHAGNTYRLVEVTYIPETAGSFASAYRIECGGCALGTVRSTSLMFGRKWWSATGPDEKEAPVMHERRRDCVAVLCGAVHARAVARVDIHMRAMGHNADVATPIDRILAGA